MAYANERVVFIHVPKTGGTWAVEAMRRAGVELHPIGVHRAKWKLDLQGRFTLGFVRQPLSWYASFWQHRRIHEDADGQDLDEWSHLDFPDFLSAVVAEKPGYLTSLFNAFLGIPRQPVDFIGRFETLEDDLVRGLGQAGLDFDEDNLRSVEPINQGGPAPACPPELERRLFDAERETYERFYGDAGAPGGIRTHDSRIKSPEL
jgi:hypothetical protein